MSIFRRNRAPYVRPADQDQSKLGTTWADVEGMIKQRAFPKGAGRILLGLVIAVFGLVCAGIWNVHQINALVNSNHSLVKQVQAGSVANCVAGNKARATDVRIWDTFIGLLVNNPNAAPTRAFLISSIAALSLPPAEVQAFTLIIDKNWSGSPEDRKTAVKFEAYIARNEPQVDCTQVYGGAEAQAYSMRIPARG